MRASHAALRASFLLAMASATFACAEGVAPDDGGGSEPSGNSSQGAGNEGGSGNEGGAGNQGGAGNEGGTGNQGGSPNEGGSGSDGGAGGGGPGCDPGLTDCNGDCVDLLTDPAHCGSCPNACPAGPANTVPTCEAQTCGFVCAGTFADCNSDLGQPGGNGCEVDTSVDSCDLTFTFTGAAQTFTVPSGTNAIQFSVAGAQGGSGFASNNNFGGLVTGTLAVSPGDVLNIFVGGQPAGTAGGFNGGGAGESLGTGGGGASDIRLNGVALSDRVVVAGGGGGGGFWSLENVEVIGGQGGGLSGTAGLRPPDNAGGEPGTQTGSGTGTCVNYNVTTMAGGLGFGGTPAGFNCGCDGYGGGGGYYGGAGSGNCRGGGGGSGFTGPAVSGALHTVGGAPAGNGSVTLTLL